MGSFCKLIMTVKPCHSENQLCYNAYKSEEWQGLGHFRDQLPANADKGRITLRDVFRERLVRGIRDKSRGKI